MTQSNANKSINSKIGLDAGLLHDLYQLHKPELCVYLIRKLGFTVPDAEEVVHIAFEKIIKMSVQQLSEIKNARAFLYKAVYNVAIDSRRHSSVGQRYVENLSFDFSRQVDERDPCRSSEANQDLRTLVEVLKRMPKKRRKLIVMNRFDGLSYAEISRRVNLSETVVRKHVTRALADCMSALRIKNSEISNEKN